MNGTVPVDILTSCSGGQKVEAFLSADALANLTCGGGTIPGSNDKSRSYRTTQNDDNSLIRLDPFFGDQIANTQLWNAMIHLLLAMQFVGAVWYQGESNQHDAMSYAYRFPAMITDLHLRLDLPKLSFLYIELVGFKAGQTWPWVQAAQAAALQLPGVGRATAVDLSDPDSPFGGIHSIANKKLVDD